MKYETYWSILDLPTNDIKSYEVCLWLSLICLFLWIIIKYFKKQDEDNKVMDNKSFELIKFKVGEKFLQYVLNYNLPIELNKKIEEFEFNKFQINQLEFILKYIEQCDYLCSKEPNTSIKMFLFNNGSIFNKMRENCNGKIEKRQNDDKILNFLFLKKIEYYPSLLISDKNKIFSKSFVFETYFHLEHNEYKNFLDSLIDSGDFNEIINGEEEDFFKAITFNFSNNKGFVYCFLHQFIEDFIVRAFLNSCYRIKYDLKDVLIEIENQYLKLKQISKKELIETSFFCGINGLHLRDVDEFNLTNEITLRNINETNNPGIENTASIASTDENSKFIIGCTLEYKINLKSLGRNKHLETVFTINNDEINTIFNNFIYSHIISLDSIYPPINISFTDSDIPLSKIPPQMKEYKNYDITTLTNNELESIREYYRIISEIDPKYISLTLKRIKSALYDRDDYIDSILDAFISWESMFSSEISTTSSVIKSIHKILEKTDYKISKTKLDELYSLRSSIVHGNPIKHKLLEVDNPEHSIKKQEEIKNQTITIAIKVFKVLIKDKLLVNKFPKDRVKILLNPKEELCPDCKKIKYNFN